jgi:hypothetical protein
MQMIGIPVCAGNPLVVLKPKTFTELGAYPLKIVVFKLALISWGNAYLDTDKLIFATGIAGLKLQKLLVNSFCRFVLYQVRHNQVSFLGFPQGIFYGPATVFYGFGFSDHQLYPFTKFSVHPWPKIKQSVSEAGLARQPIVLSLQPSPDLSFGSGWISG